MACNANRIRVLALYKELHRLGRDYPDPRSFLKPLIPTLVFWGFHSYNFHGKLRQMFESESWVSVSNSRYILQRTENKDLTNEEDIEKAIRLGEYIKNGERHVLSICTLSTGLNSNVFASHFVPRNACSLLFTQISTPEKSVSVCRVVEFMTFIFNDDDLFCFWVWPCPL